MEEEATCEKQYLSPQTVSAFELSLLALTIALFVRYAQFLWNRRHLYWYSCRVPGPFSLPFVGSALSYVGLFTGYLDAMDQMYKQYGEHWKIWIGTQLWCGVSSPEHLLAILKNPKALEKSQHCRFFKTIFSEGVLTAPVKKWRKNRRIMAPTFNQHILDQYVEVFYRTSNILAERLENVSGKGVFDVLDTVSRCTIDSVCETSFGVPVHAQEEDFNYLGWIHRLMDIGLIRLFNLHYHSDTIFKMSAFGKEAAEIRSKFRKYTGEIIKQKKLEHEEKRQLGDVSDNVILGKSFLDSLIQLSYNDDSRLTNEEINDEVDNVIVAGSDTSAVANCFTLLLLGMHPEIQQKVYDEITNVIGPGDINSGDLPNLVYLERVIKESLRLFPVVPVILRHADGDINVGDEIIPSGTQIAIGIFWLHRNEEYWPDPLKFDPDRFSPEEVAKRHPCAFLPFSFGPRNCIGYKFGVMSMKTILATIIRKYKIYTVYKSTEEVELKLEVMLMPKEGFKVYIEKREM